MKVLKSLAVIVLCIPLVADAAIVSETYTKSVGTVIQDGPPGGGSGTPLMSIINVPLGYDVVDVEVYIDIAIIEWSSDLIIRLTSPMGTELRLFFIGEGGEPATNPAGWYPVDFTPKDDMSQWVGEMSAGDWVLDCRDYSHEVVGVLNEWRLRIYYDDTLAGETDTWSGIKAIYR